MIVFHVVYSDSSIIKGNIHLAVCKNGILWLSPYMLRTYGYAGLAVAM